MLRGYLAWNPSDLCNRPHPTNYTQIELDKTETRVYAMFHVSDTVHTSHTETAGELAATDIAVGPRAVQQPFCGGPPGVPGVRVC